MTIRPPVPTATDAALGAVVAVLSLVALWTPPAFVSYEFAEPDALGVALALLGGVALAFRSQAPLPALVGTTAASLLSLVLGYSSTLGGLPVLLALYSVAVSTPVLVSGLASLALFGLVSAAVLASPFPPTVVDWIGNALVIVLGWAIGWSVRGRRAYTARLEERNAALVAARESDTRAALAQERNRIAREMQDVVTHTLTSLTVQAAAARRLVRSDPDNAELALGEVERTARAATDEMRRILGVLPTAEPPSHEPAPGVADLPRLLHDAERRGLTGKLVVVGEPAALPPGVDLTAYRIVEESLAEAPSGSAVRVELSWRSDRLEVEVERPRDASLPGATRAALRERARVYGGSLREQVDDGLVRISAVLPLDPALGPAST